MKTSESVEKVSDDHSDGQSDDHSNDHSDDEVLEILTLLRI